MATADPETSPKICPVCGHENVPRARFCARCGQALDGDPVTDEAGVDETQATSTYVPIGGVGAEGTWDEPEAERTTALPVQDAVWSPSSPTVSASVPLAAPHRESPRGFILGALATLIILAVLGYYIYAAWFSESLQNDIAAWLPW